MVSLSAALAVLVLSAPPSQTVMLDFSAPWCPSCRAMDPTVRELEARGYPVRRVNVDEEKALAGQLQVEKIPCFVMLVDGQEVDRVVGGTTYSRLERMCKAAAAAARRSAPPATVVQAAPPAAILPPAAIMPAARSSVVPAAWTPRQENPPLADATLLAASVRLRVEDPDGRSCGSGTIIDARGGEALILTCGHIFRDSKGKGPIEVDLFGPGGPQRVKGQLIAYDAEKNDVGLVSIHTSGPVVAVRVAPAGGRVACGDAVVTVGCNNGADPTAHHGRVLSVDKFMGPANLQVEGEPVKGRSGGGVFSRDGLLVGICNAADQSEHAGYCVALPTIYAELDRAHVGFVYKEPAKAVCAHGTGGFARRAGGRRSGPRGVAADVSRAADRTAGEAALRRASGNGGDSTPTEGRRRSRLHHPQSAGQARSAPVGPRLAGVCRSTLGEGPRPAGRDVLGSDPPEDADPGVGPRARLYPSKPDSGATAVAQPLPVGAKKQPQRNNRRLQKNAVIAIMAAGIAA